MLCSQTVSPVYHFVTMLLPSCSAASSTVLLPGASSVTPSTVLSPGVSSDAFQFILTVSCCFDSLAGGQAVDLPG